MPTKVNVPAPFLRELRRLAKKYPAVLKQFETLAEQLKADERPGDKIPRVGRDVYKVRLANPSAKRGKSGGFRVIYYVQLVDSVLMVTIYSKTEQNDISPEEIRRIVDEIMPPDDDEERESDDA
jgi:mRNA-degrading endonuclease RelE of RelBE toxin-antitoxin system